MHFQTCIFGAVLLSIVSGISGNTVCKKENEVFNNGEDRCEKHCGFKTFIEFEWNRPNCNCEPNFARNKKGECVPAERCVYECGENEEFVNSTKKSDFTCKCRPGFFRKNGVCIFCEHLSENINRCKQFDREKCSCKKCNSASVLCNGVCKQNHINCENYNFKYGLCTECSEGFTLHEGACKAKCSITCQPNEIMDEKTCTCIPCSNRQIACKNQCWDYPSNCGKFETSTCRCIQCDIGYVLKKGRCVADVPEENCLPNQSYGQYDITCTPTCSNPKPKNCASKIITGCHCSEGFVHDTVNDECIKLANCPKCRLENEEYLSCGSACPPTCDTPSPTICTKQCVSGCFCKKGFVRDLNSGRCVQIEDCSCSFNNTQFCVCGPYRPQTCKNPFLFTDNPNCEYSPGCYCVDGTVRDTNTGKCVPREECSCSRENEVYKICGTACEPSCLEPVKPCAEICMPGCFCKDGFLRNENGECVQKCACPPNEVYGNDGCVCRPGYERNPKSGLCEKVKEPQCRRPNEQFNECGSHCPKSCRSMEPRFCILSCNPGCFCANGTIRDDDTGLCVAPEQCCKRPNEAYFKCYRSHSKAQCQEGCFCINGTARNSYGQCVHESNESYSDCSE